MESLLRDLQTTERNAPMPAPPVAHLATQELTWAKEYLASERHVISAPDWTKEYLESQPEDVVWSQEFVNDSTNEAAKELLDSVSDPALTTTNFFQFIEDIASAQASQWVKEFTDTNKSESKLMSAWTDAEEHDDSNEKLWRNLESRLHEMVDSDESSWVNSFLDNKDEYKFSDSNPWSDHPDPLAKGQELLKLGDVSSAILLFECAAQREPENAEAWLLLGTSLAENEQDPQAIQAFGKCIGLEPSNLRALMALSISLTNESYQNQACATLEKWLSCNPKYSHIVKNAPTQDWSLATASSFLSSELHDRVLNLFLEAQQSIHKEEVDPEIQSGIGVLLNLSGDYDKASDCFRAALQVRPDDSLLWNRLGATLANGGKSAEAVEAYKQALDMAPRFVRCRYNLAISCINLDANEQASDHLLAALNQQHHGQLGSVTSDAIWSTFRMVTSLLGRHDLLPAIDSRDLEQLNSIFQSRYMPSS